MSVAVPTAVARRGQKNKPTSLDLRSSFVDSAIQASLMALAAPSVRQSKNTFCSALA